MKIANGDIVAWLNSDDWYEADTLKNVANQWLEKEFDVLHGDANFCFDADQSKNFSTHYGSNCTLQRLMRYWSYSQDCNPPQPSVFIKRKLFDQLGLLDTSYHYAMDYDLWLKIAQAGYSFTYIPKVLSNYRFHRESKSGGEADFRHFHKEWHMVYQKNLKKLRYYDRLKFFWDYNGFYYGYSKFKLPLRMLNYLVRPNIKQSKYD